MNAHAELAETIDRLFDAGGDADPDESRRAVEDLLEALREGTARAALHEDGRWHAVPWVKRGILLAFRAGQTAAFDAAGPMVFFDRDSLPLRPTRGVDERVRIVPGGSSVRDGVYLGPNVVMMPPAFVNIGAYVDEGAMIDSHALVGSCAQVGARVHLSAGAQLGGVLEPVGMRPVIIEEDALIGGNTGVFEGTLVSARAVIAPGVNLTASTTVYDAVRETTYRATADAPLTIPEGAVVVPGSRPLKSAFGTEEGLSLYAPIIVKYRDERTDAATALEDALR